MIRCSTRTSRSLGALRFCGLAAILALSFPLASARELSEAATAAGVQLLLIEDVREFPDATEPGAIRFACASDAAPLPQFFAARRVPFRAALVRKYGGFNACHVYYEQSIPGYRALPDDRPITGMVSGIAPAGLVGRRKVIGDSLDVAREVLRQIDRPLDVTFTVAGEFDRSYWPDGLKRSFPESIHRFTLIPSEADETHPWGQDLVKAGVVDGELRILVPRRLFEGRSEDGGLFRPLLESLRDPRFTRSKLSWEGGDLQFIAAPKDPSRTILFHGGSPQDYWGANLNPEESSYVLQVEFGVDAAVDLSQVGLHADYLTAFLPEERIVLVAEPVRDDLNLAWATAVELDKLYEERAPEGLRTLVDILGQARRLDTAPESLATARRLVRALLETLPEVPARVPPALDARLEAHEARFCLNEAMQCYVGEGKRTMLREDPELMRAVLDAAADVKLEPMISSSFLRIIESQLSDFPDTISRRIDAGAARIRKLGFRVIRTPHLYSPEAAREGWPGISYVNSLLFEKTLFVPAVGLGEYENKLFSSLQKKLPRGYRVEPVYARFALMNNGGVHCAFGILRDPGSRLVSRLGSQR